MTDIGEQVDEIKKSLTEFASMMGDLSSRAPDETSRQALEALGVELTAAFAEFESSLPGFAAELAKMRSAAEQSVAGARRKVASIRSVANAAPERKPPAPEPVVEPDEELPGRLRDGLLRRFPPQAPPEQIDLKDAHGWQTWITSSIAASSRVRPASTEPDALTDQEAPGDPFRQMGWETWLLKAGRPAEEAGDEGTVGPKPYGWSTWLRAQKQGKVELDGSAASAKPDEPSPGDTNPGDGGTP